MISEFLLAFVSCVSEYFEQPEWKCLVAISVVSTISAFLAMWVKLNQKG